VRPLRNRSAVLSAATMGRLKGHKDANMLKMCLKFSVLGLFLFAVPRVWAQGPPYQTDDPVPVDYGHSSGLESRNQSMFRKSALS
jgi:hypothetical protein